MKKILLCGKCLDNAGVGNLRKKDEIGEIGSCSERCGKYGYMHRLTPVEHGAFKAGQRKVAKALEKTRAENQAKALAKQVQAEKEVAERQTAVRRAVNLRSITL